MFKFNIGDEVVIVSGEFYDEREYLRKVTTVTSRATLTFEQEVIYYYLLSCDNGARYWEEHSLESAEKYITRFETVTNEEFDKLLME